MVEKITSKKAKRRGNKRGYFILFLYFVILFFSFDAFGLKPYELGRYAGSLYGVFYLLSIGIMIFMLLYVPKNMKIIKSPIGKSVLLIGLLIFFYSALEIIQGRVSNLINLLALKSFILFFTTLVVYEKAGLDKLWNLLKLISLICSLIAIVVVALNIPDLSIQVKKSSEYGDTGVLIPTGLVIAFGMFAFLTSFLKKKRKIDLAFALLCMGACFIQQHKGVIISMAFTLFLSYSINKRISLKSIIGGISLIVVAYFVLSILLSKSGFLVNELIEEFTQIGSGGHSDETAMLRFLMLGNAYNYVLTHYGLGIGLNWQEYDVVEYVYNAFALSPTMDSGYYNIIIMFGIYGILVYLYCFVSTIRVLNIKRKRADNGLQEQICTNSLLVFFIYILMSSISGEFFLLDESSMFYISLALSFIVSSRNKKVRFKRIRKQ